MLYYLATGALLGLGAGFSPGPLLALVVSETLCCGVAAGIRVALAPLVSDLPIVSLVLLGLGQVSQASMLPGVLSVIGGCLLLYMGWEELHKTGVVVAEGGVQAHPLRRGILVNALSPYPYLFWLGVGGPILVRGWDQSRIAPVVFLGSFYLCLVGSKVLLAVAVGRMAFLNSKVYCMALRGIALLLCLFGLSLLYEGAFLCGLIP